MKRVLVTGLMLLATLTLSACAGHNIYSGTVVLDGAHGFDEGDIIDGELVVFGGKVMLARGSRVTGSVYMLGGALEVDGEVSGDVLCFDGDLTLGPDATVGGNLTVGGDTFARSPQATINGQVNAGAGMREALSPVWPEQRLGERLRGFALQTVVLAALAFAAVKFRPKPVARIGEAIARHPVVSGAMGLLVGVVSLSLLVLMAFTVILIPVALLGILALFASIAYGWIAVGAMVGQRVARRLKWNITPGAAAAFGVVLFMLVVNGVGLLPGLFSLIPLAAMAVGLGAVLLTRFGRRTFVPASEIAPSGLENLTGLGRSDHV